jgi:hypothetical protein
MRFKAMLEKVHIFLGTAAINATKVIQARAKLPLNNFGAKRQSSVRNCRKELLRGGPLKLSLLST